MPRNQPILLGTLTIPQDKTESDHLDMRRLPIRGISVFGPDVLTGTVRFQTTYNLDASHPSLIRFVDLQSGGANLVIGAAENVPIDFVCWHALRVVSSSIESAERVFVVLAVEDL